MRAAAVTGSSSRYCAPTASARSELAPLPASASGADLGDLGQAVARARGLGGGRGREHDQRGLQQTGRLGDGCERRVRPQERDAPAPAPQCQTEADQPQVVLVAGQTRQQCQRRAAAAPAASEAEQPAAQHGARKMLLPDRRLAAFPALPELAEVGQHSIAQDGVQGEGGQQPVERSMRAGLVEAIERLPQVIACRAGRACVATGSSAARRRASSRARRAPSAAETPESRCRSMRRTRRSSSSP